MKYVHTQKSDPRNAHPDKSCERATHENTNEPLRQYFPKKTDLSKITEKELQRAMRKIHSRLRERLSFKNTYELQKEEILKSRKWVEMTRLRSTRIHPLDMIVYSKYFSIITDDISFLSHFIYWPFIHGWAQVNSAIILENLHHIPFFQM